METLKWMKNKIRREDVDIFVPSQDWMQQKTIVTVTVNVPAL
jgi:hypothetical protein